jgi:FdhD protein
MRWRSGDAAEATDSVAVEEPLEIRLGGRRFTLTMRTPGHDEELVAGFLFAEGFVESGAEIAEIRRVRTKDGTAEPNIVDIILNVNADSLRERLSRNFAQTSSCGMCGKTTIEAITRRITPIAERMTVAPNAIVAMESALRTAQGAFAQTGGLHAAALFTPNAELIAAREDVGRHNAVDKLVGHALAKSMIPARGLVMLVSGRISFEIAQKAAASGTPVLAALSAPSSLAIELADECGLTLVGFIRGESFNVYTHADRIGG